MNKVYASAAEALKGLVADNQMIERLHINQLQYLL